MHNFFSIQLLYFKSPLNEHYVLGIVRYGYVHTSAFSFLKHSSVTMTGILENHFFSYLLQENYSDVGSSSLASGASSLFQCQAKMFT